ncbi:MAG TPA: hypothetical protein V6D21_12560 [Candidatus Obscuribacterales bacterium]
MSVLKCYNLDADSYITHYPLPITHYPLPITHYLLPITDYRLPIHYPLFIPYF